MIKKSEKPVTGYIQPRVIVTPLTAQLRDVEGQRQIPTSPNHRDAELARAERKFGAQVRRESRPRWEAIMRRLLQA